MDAETYEAHLRAGEYYGQQATCGNKINYKSEETAVAAAASGNFRKPVEAYPCAWCLGWHVGRAMSSEELDRFRESRL